jgi:outer membrane lipoprotein-sorting protein
MTLKGISFKLKNIIYLFILVSFFGLTFAGVNISAKEWPLDSKTSIDEIIDRLQKKMSEVFSIKACFIEEKELSVFNQKIILQGKLYLKKPGLFAWHVLKPVRYSMVIDKDTVRQWDEETGLVQQMSIAKNPAFEIAIAKMQDWFAGNYARLRKEYEIALVKDNPLTLSFVPLKDSIASNMIKRVIVTFQNDQRYIEQIRIEEKSQDITLLKFFNTGFNVQIDAAAWEAKPRVR